MMEQTQAHDQVFVPGCWRCAKCNFVLHQFNINANSGNVTVRDEPGDKCPNDGAPLWRVTWREDAIEMSKRTEEQMQRAVRAEAEIVKLLQGSMLPQPMATAPRNGTRILAYLYSEPDDCGYRGFGEWREIYWKPYRSLGMFLPWHAGDPWDSHDQIEAPDHFGEAVPIAWLPCPTPPVLPERSA